MGIIIITVIVIIVVVNVVVIIIITTGGGRTVSDNTVSRGADDPSSLPYSPVRLTSP